MKKESNPMASDKSKKPLPPPAPPGKWSEEVLTRLVVMTERGIKAEKLTNDELSEWVLEHVWAQYGIDSIESAIFGEIIERLNAPNKPLNSDQAAQAKKCTCERCTGVKLESYYKD